MTLDRPASRHNQSGLPTKYYLLAGYFIPALNEWVAESLELKTVHRIVTVVPRRVARAAIGPATEQLFALS